MEKMVNKVIKFKKEFHPRSNGYNIISDAYILNVINALSEEHNFTVKKVSLKDWSSTCRITIRCPRDKWYFITTAFATTMGDTIKEVNI